MVILRLVGNIYLSVYLAIPAENKAACVAK